MMRGGTTCNNTQGSGEASCVVVWQPANTNGTKRVAVAYHISASSDSDTTRRCLTKSRLATTDIQVHKGMLRCQPVLLGLVVRVFDHLEHSASDTCSARVVL